MAYRPIRRRSLGAFKEVNLTPLIDVMLVLLIVFMVTAPLLTAGLPVDLPRVSAEPAPVQDLRLVITVTADERIYLDNREVTGEIDSFFRSDPALAHASELYVRADQDVRYGVVAQVVAAARARGIESLALIVEPDKAALR